MEILLAIHEKTIRAIWPIVFLLLVMASPAFAQVAPTGTISGVITDPAGLLLPNASVTVINPDLNFQRSEVTNSNGARIGREQELRAKQEKFPPPRFLAKGECVLRQGQAQRGEASLGSADTSS